MKKLTETLEEHDANNFDFAARGAVFLALSALEKDNLLEAAHWLRACERALAIASAIRRKKSVTAKMLESDEPSVSDHPSIQQGLEALPTLNPNFRFLVLDHSDFVRSLAAATISPINFARIMINLAKNVVDHGLPGEIQVSLHAIDLIQPLFLRFPPNAVASGKYLRIEVQDVGPGIPEDLLKALPGASSKANSNTHGLGLRSVLDTLQSVGGGLQIESSFPGFTRITVYIPMIGNKSSSAYAEPMAA